MSHNLENKLFNKGVKKAVNLGLATLLSLSLNLANAETNNPKAKEYLERGVEKFGYGNYSEAIQNYEEVIKLDPTCTEAYNRTAEIYILSAEFDKAILNAQKSISVNPKDGGGYQMLGLAYYRRAFVEKNISYYGEAEKNLAKAVKVYRKQNRDIDADAAEVLLPYIREHIKRGSTDHID